jgi:signal recognition particle subunit SRP54
MFEGITQNLTSALSVFRRTGKLTEGNIRDGMRQVRQALLEADVNYDVATDFMKAVTEQSLGDRVLKSLNPSEQIVGIVYQELVNLMGPVDHSLHLRRDGITIIMLCGLQGSGKTTTCGKLANNLKSNGRKPMLVAADLQRPAAIEQLKVLGDSIGVPVHTEDPKQSTPLKVCQNALKKAKKEGGVDVVILDTAGRLHIDDELMRELELIDNKLQPHQVYLVCDAMTGQDAVNSAKAFNEALELDGVILTKLDGDTRGGAALSVKAVTGVPIKFVGVGEQVDKLDEFHPDRMAGRILGGGDMATLVERAQAAFDEEEMAAQQAKMLEGKFTLEDFRKAMKTMTKLGSLKDVMKMIPGLGGMMDQNPDVDPTAEMKRVEGIINSMTPEERTNPDRIDRSRRNRIAYGSGCDPSEVNKLLKDFQNMAGKMQQMAGMGAREKMRAVKEMAAQGMDPNANMQKEKTRTKRGPLDKQKAKAQKKNKRKQQRKSKRRNRR